MTRFIHSTAFLAATLFVAVPVHAEPTDITVHVLSKDAKFIGSSMGSMRVTLRDGHTGEILASGLTTGGTGDTKRIMHTDAGRRVTLSDASAAKFTTTLDLDRPRFVEVEAYGPLAQPQAAHRVTSSQWVVPGKHVTGGDGWMLELPGMIVDVLGPPAHVKLPATTEKVDISANVMLMCGCPIEPGGIWDAKKYEVRALITHNGKALEPIDLGYAGAPSQFAAVVPVSGAGIYDVTVYAYDASNGNTGLDRTTFVVDKK